MDRPIAPVLTALTLAMSVPALASCGSDSSGPPATSVKTPGKVAASPSEDPRSALPRIDLPVKKNETVEGLG